jgi:hypothetical protein
MPIIEHMMEQGRFDREGGLPITCVKHNTTIQVNDPEMWTMLAGGCTKLCGGLLPCDHPCPLACHPYDHQRVKCREPCAKLLKCGHGCSRNCREECVCDERSCVALAQRSFIENADAVSRRPVFNTFNTQDIRQETSFPSTPTKSDPKKWQAWNAKAADKKALEENTRSKIYVDPSKQVYKETYKAVTVKDGVRVSDRAASTHRQLSELSIEVPAALLLLKNQQLMISIHLRSCTCRWWVQGRNNLSLGKWSSSLPSHGRRH